MKFSTGIVPQFSAMMGPDMLENIKQESALAQHDDDEFVASSQ